MNVLITGGGGFIGRSLKRLLPPLGYTVYAPTHNELDVLDNMRTYEYVRSKDIDVIIHTAARSIKPGVYDIDYSGFRNNIEMFESIKSAVFERNVMVIDIGTGAEFDRREPINNASEQLLWTRWPVDLYGLSKNIVARRTLEELQNGCVFRLFGCFGEDDYDERFIKKCILRLKNGLPVELKARRAIDFFYIDDVAIVLDDFLRNGGVDNLNLVYTEKYELETVANMIQEEMEVISDVVYVESDSVYHPTYTGDASSLKQKGLKLIGLREGIRRMVKSLV